jgi:hypothetical protein
MADRAKKISELTSLAAAATNDVVIILDSSESETKSISVASLFGSVPSNTTFGNAAIVSANTLVVRNKTTPANNSVTVTEGTIFYDENYLYVAIANNTIRRVALSTF